MADSEGGTTGGQLPFTPANHIDTQGKSKEESKEKDGEDMEFGGDISSIMIAPNTLNDDEDNIQFKIE